MGIQSFYGFGLFVGEAHGLINFNLPDLAVAVVERISIQLNNEPLLPLSYEANVRFEGQPQIKGLFQNLG